jgi:hypothetical protein
MIAYWLLPTPVLAQAGFVILVPRLVKRVPAIVMLPMDRPPVCRASPTTQNTPTVIRFVNQTAIEIHVWWLDLRMIAAPCSPPVAKQRRARIPGTAFCFQ